MVLSSICFCMGLMGQSKVRGHLIGQGLGVTVDACRDLENPMCQATYSDCCIGSVCLACGVGKVVGSGQVKR
jgi:hypothetical protein